MHARRRAEAEADLFIVAPKRLAQFLSYYHHKIEPVLEGARHIHNEHLLLSYASQTAQKKTQLIYPEVLEDLCRSTGLKSIAVSRAVHCANAFCVALTTARDDFKIVYTGDTRPNEDLNVLGR